ncbi:MAG: hypothetical protein JOZ69_06785, partial [Myxococcales bacterium]|nr:hypothetical protein [Myxococcales bacterium]
MQTPPLRRGGPAQSAEAFSFETTLENEEATLDAMLAATTRGALPPGAWDRLHAAAQRDERMSELAFAFESVSQGKRMKALPPAQGAEFLFQAGRFFGEIFGDEVGAVTYLERALALAPGHAAALAKIEQVLLHTDQARKLADVLVGVAQHRPRAEQATLLRRAADILAGAGGQEERLIELLQHLLKLNPGDEPTRAELEELCIKANRLRDVVRLNEQALAAEPPPDDATRRKILARIVEVYADKLHEPERAMPQVEQLLAIDAGNEQGRKVAARLIQVKGLAGRAAAALANAHEAVGAPEDVARYLAVELENTRGPKRATLLARLGRLRLERLRDDAGAFDALEQALAIDATEDGLREGYVGLAKRLGRFADAAKTLGRVHSTLKAPDVKARTGAQLGEMLRLGGDVKRAKATLAGVVGAAEAPPEALLAAARALAEIAESERDRRALADNLERVVALEADPERRQRADERLAAVATELGDTPRAIAAYERLLSTGARPLALAALAPLYAAAAAPDKQARLLEEQAKDALDPAAARASLLRAAEVRASSNDAAGAIATCRAVVERFGPARDVHAVLLPLLEAQRRWPDLARTLADEAALASGAERTQLLTRLGTVRLQRLSDVPLAIEAFAQALAADPQDKTSRTLLERLTVAGEHRLAAARVLEPLYRREGASAALVKLLELRGTLSEDAAERLGALGEAASLAAGRDPARAADIVGRALADAVAHERPIGEWLERLEGLPAGGLDAKRRAGILGGAIGDREVTNDDLAALAKLAAQAHADAGEGASAMALYRRALAFDPHSTELLSRIDDLLRDQGSPAERISLYRAALAGAGLERRRELLHRIGAVERHDLGDVPAAIATYRAALEEDALDVDAETALAELYAEAGRWGELCTLLEARLARTDGDAARATRATLAGVAAAHGDRERARAHATGL